MSSSLAGFTGRYATALYELAEEAGRTDAVAEDLKKIQTMVAESADLERLISSPAINII